MSVSSSQCLEAGETCDSLTVDTILALMMNAKTSTKPLVVVDEHGRPEITGQFHTTLNVCRLGNGAIE